MAQVHHASLLALCQLADTVHCECIMQSRASTQLRSQCSTRSRYSSSLTWQPITTCYSTHDLVQTDHSTHLDAKVISLNYIFFHNPGHAMLCMRNFISIKQPFELLPKQLLSLYFFKLRSAKSCAIILSVCLISCT